MHFRFNSIYRSIYGFRDADSTFLKILLTDPAEVPILAEMLLSGAALGFPIQPFETHIPYLLQFCADYNLQGMNYLEACCFRLRGKYLSNLSLKFLGVKTTKVAGPNEPSDALSFMMTQEYVAYVYFSDI